MAPRGRPAATATNPGTNPGTAAMPRRAARKRLKFRADDVCSERGIVALSPSVPCPVIPNAPARPVPPSAVTVADYANSDPAVVKSGRVKKAVANAVQQEVKSLCGLEASCVPAEEVLSVSGESCDSSDEMDTKESINGRAASRKKKSKRHKESAEGGGGEEYPIDIWLLLASYIRPEDIVRFSLICKKAWTVTCTAAFWTRLYRRGCLDGHQQSLVINLEQGFCLLFWCKKIVGNRQEAMWEFNFKFKKQSPRFKSKCCKGLQPPIQYEEVHTNPDQDCCLLQITTFNFIFVPIVMGMTFTLFTINVSTDMRHHRVRLVFQDAPVRNGKKPRLEQGVQVVLDPVHSVRLLDWWHPQYPFSPKA
ncbi:transmembrane protein 183A [Willisornis vidua]|uniref:Transmembrane protein 183A n=1 Tax=Willisornis vidua TaxID=1566151 RepID=A0ABQ9D2X6_9PASS|nr:transmembrane protein 183A [Willisornis vidua]